MPSKPINARNQMPTQSGFTLTELAVVLVIVALLIGGMLMPLATQQDIQSRQSAAKALATIQEALVGFAVVNGRLPCPADGTIASGSSGAGLEATSGSGATLACVNATGVVPWATLGVLETDPWGNRYTYRVTADFGRGIPQTTFGSCTPTAAPTAASFALCSAGDASILTAASGATTIASTVPAVVVCHGKNGLGAYNTMGTQTSGAAGDEAENADADAVFVSSTAIDDQVSWISLPVLMNRMIAAGKLP